MIPNRTPKPPYDQAVTMIGQLVWWLRGFGNAVEVFAPEGLLG